MQWTGCHGEERHGGDRGCGGGCNEQGVMVSRHGMTFVVEEDTIVMVREDLEVTEDTMNFVSW